MVRFTCLPLVAVTMVCLSVLLVAEAGVIPKRAYTTIGAGAAGGAAVAALAWLGNNLFNTSKYYRKSVEFLSPVPETQYQCGQMVPVQLQTHAVGSLFGLETSEFQLTNINTGTSVNVATFLTKDLIHSNRPLYIGEPREGSGTFNMQIPYNLAPGPYRIDYKLADLWHTSLSKKTFHSKKFFISC